jgi:hypothetical protein
MLARDLFDAIQAAHFNINTHIQEREEQRKRLAEQKKHLDSPAPAEEQREQTS